MTVPIQDWKAQLLAAKQEAERLEKIVRLSEERDRIEQQLEELLEPEPELDASGEAEPDPEPEPEPPPVPRRRVPIRIRRRSSTLSDEARLECSRCGRLKPVSFFYADQSSKTGYKKRCKDCIRESIGKETTGPVSKRYRPHKRKLQCPCCGKMKWKRDFYAYRSKASGRKSTCRECRVNPPPQHELTRRLTASQGTIF